MKNVLCWYAATTATAILAAQTAIGAVTFLSQNRLLQAHTTADGQLGSVTAPDFGPFVESLSLATTFPGQAGGVLPNVAAAGIDCHVDPDAIRASGALQAAGGISVNGAPESGEARADLRFTFQVDVLTPYRIIANPRPIGEPTDGYEIKLRNTDLNDNLYESPEGPPIAVDDSGVLLPGNYSLRYFVELTSSDGSNGGPFSFQFLLGRRCGGACVADVDDGQASGTPDGGVTIDDLLYYLNLYVSGLSCADIDDGTATGTPDGGVTVDDLLFYLSRFEAGC